MGKFSKLLSSLFLIALGLLLFSITITYQKVGKFSFELLPYSDYPKIGKYVPEVLFWASIFFITVIIILLIFVIFGPRKVDRLNIKENNGSLTIDKKAIENFTKGIIENSSDIENPSVKAKMTKRKIKLKISGNLPAGADVPTRQQLLIDEINSKFKTLLGVNSNINTKIRFKNFDSKEKDVAVKKEGKPRVV